MKKKIEKKPETERRFREMEIRAIDESDDKMIIEGTPIVYEQETDLGWFREKIAKGAAKEALANSDIFLLFNHNSDKPLARVKNKTLEAWEEDDGVHMKADLSKSALGPGLYQDIKNGLIDKMSFAFTVEEESWDEKEGEPDLRTVVKIKELFDLSPVTYPAYKQTELVARSAEKITENHKAALAELESSVEEDRSYLDELDVCERELKLIEGEI